MFKKFFEKYRTYFVIGISTVVLMGMLKIFDNQLTEKGRSKSFIEEFYLKNLKPIFVNNELSNEDMVNFALYDYVPVDKNNNKYMKVNINDLGREEIKIVDVASETRSNNYDYLVDQYSGNSDIRSQIDPILEKYRKYIYTSVMSNSENNSYAVNPEIYHINQALKAELLAVFFPENQNLKNASRVFKSSFENYFLGDSKKSNMVVIAPDTIFSTMISLPKEYSKAVKMIQRNGYINKLDYELVENMPELNYKISEKVLQFDCSIPDAPGVAKTIRINLLDSLLKNANDNSNSVNFKISENGFTIKTPNGKQVFNFDIDKIDELIMNETEAEETAEKWKNYGLKIDSLVQVWKNSKDQETKIKSNKIIKK